MYRQKIFMWGLIIFLIPSLACGLLDFGSEDAAEEAGAVQVDLGAEEESPSEEPAAPVEPAPESESAGDSVAAETEAEPVEEAAAAEAAPDTAEAGPTEFTGVIGLEDLNAYRAAFSMEFDGTSGGQPAVGRIDMALEATRTPNARHLTMKMEGTTAEQMGGANEMEVYIIEDTIYMKNSAMGNGWLSFSGAEAQAFDTGFFQPQESLELPQRATCGDTETINGISARHCTFTQADIGNDGGTYDQLNGEVWLAEEGDYVVKYTLTADGFRSAEEGTGLFDFGSVQFNYELSEINGDITITLPEAATAGGSLDLGGEPAEESGTAGSDLPMLADAEGVNNLAGTLMYSSATDLNAAVDFYRQELAAAGWQENEGQSFVSDAAASLSFGKDGQTLSVTIAPEGERISVILLTQ